ncbi:MAG: hypothetical protein ACJZ81_07695 [Paracoccaceae bacterium]
MSGQREGFKNASLWDEGDGREEATRRVADYGRRSTTRDKHPGRLDVMAFS